MWETTDLDGRRVILTFERWRHVLEDHGELRGRQAEVLQAVAAPDVRLYGRLRGEEWFYLRTAAPSRWLKVVVHYERRSGRVVTAFPRRKLP